MNQKEIKLQNTVPDAAEVVVVDLARENRIWQEFLEGDDAALSWLYRNYIDKLYNYGVQFAGREVVLDAIQDLFFELIRTRHKLSKTRSVKAYLYSSLRRKLHERKKKQADEVSVEVEMPFSIAVHPNHSTHFGIPEGDFHELQKACNALPARQREIILLYYYEEMTYPELMEVMQIDKMNSARILMHRALESLRKALAGVKRGFLLLIFGLLQIFSY